MTGRTIERLTALAGAAGMVFIVAAFVALGNYPDEGASGQQVLAFVAAHRGAMLAAVYLFGLSFAFTLCYLTGLWAVLRHDERGAEILAALGLVGGAAWILVVFPGIGFLLDLAYRPPPDPTSARTLLDGAVLASNLSGFPTAVNLAGFGAAMLVTARFPRWLAWLAFFVAGIHLIAAAADTASGPLAPSIASGFVAPALYYLWMVATSILLWRGAALPKSAAAPVLDPTTESS